MMHTLSRLLLLCCLSLCSSLYAEGAEDDWIEPTGTTIQTLKDAFNRFDASKDDNTLLSDYLTTLSALKTPTQKCVDNNTSELEKTSTETEVLAGSKTSKGSQVDKSIKSITLRHNQLKKQLVTCTAMLLEIQNLSTRIGKMQQSILATYLLAKDPNIFSILLDNITRMDSWLDTISSFLESRLQLQTLYIKDWVLLAGLLLMGGGIGKLLRELLKSMARRLTAKELTTQLSLSLCTRFARIMPYLLSASAVLAGLLLIMPTSPLPPSTAFFIVLVSYFLANTMVGVILDPRPPAEMFVNLSADYGKYLFQRLQTLVLLGLLILLASVTELQSAMTQDQWRITRSVFLLLGTINLIWLISILNRVPGILGSTVFRVLMIILLLASAVAEVIGYRNFSLYLLQGLLGSAVLAIALWLANALLVDIFDGLDEGRHRWQQYIRRKLHLNMDESVPGLLWLRLITMLAAWTVFALSVVRLWGYDAVSWTMLAQMITDGFNIGEYRIAPLKLVIAVVAFSLLITFVRWFKQETLPGWVNRTRLDHGAREAVISISGYLGIIFAAIFGLSLAGFSFTNIAIVAGALSVGIGFGLQNIVNNFISGIILLFERPIRTGDWIVVGNTEGYVRKISIRSTQIETFDRADVIVPNSELISNQVTNWMLHDPWGRVIVPVGVAYGSDVEKVREILLKLASEHKLVLTDGKKVSPPKVLFRQFGDSSLNFELRFFIKNIDRRFDTLSELNFAIEKAFRENNIEIPFPQRDLHLRSISPDIQFTDRNK